MNCKNAVFYDLIPAEELMEIAKLAGLDTCCDMDLIKPYLQSTDRILDVGGGYGRALEWLIKKGFNNLATIERGKCWLKILRSSFGDKVKIYDQDVANLAIEEQFNAILWMWASIADFSRNEQIAVLKKLVALLVTPGIVVIDSLPPPIPQSELNFCTDGQNSIFHYKRHEISLFYPSIEDIAGYSKELGMKHRYFEYRTIANRKRMLNILMK